MEVCDWLVGQGVANVSLVQVLTSQNGPHLGFLFPFASGADPLRVAIDGSLRFDPFGAIAHFGSRLVYADSGKVFHDGLATDSDAYSRDISRKVYSRRYRAELAGISGCGEPGNVKEVHGNVLRELKATLSCLKATDRELFAEYVKQRRPN